ncbi:MAG TPA: hypothetical protein DCX03_02205 [Bacteroidales bacterium]|nr:hypothetical protein [Bacteroidales bacterium]
MRFRKKPVEIEAVQLRWDTWGEVCTFCGVGKLSDGKLEGCYRGADGHPLPENENSNTIGLLIPTLEGVMVASENDWIIRGIKGELYSCKPDIFEETYEKTERKEYARVWGENT